ncbi:MAG: nucleotide exchange factor GrpE [Gammaproteobacteria bacterium]|nr:nucleotide exchange factor GrpE [Gammaproteobacteria bacterium]MCH9763727.1 nucleotide exchange factor GrpE [Gammaproteobacteria bacterium]
MSEQTKDWGKIKEAAEKLDAEILDEVTPQMEADADDGGEGEVAGGGHIVEHPLYVALEEKLTEAEQKAHDNWDKLMRITADMDNLRRRSERDVTQAHKYGLEKIINNLLPVVDSLEQAGQLAEKHDDKAMYEGLELTMKLFLDMLAKTQVEQLNPVGEIFNPEMHEAMSMQETTDAAPNTVIAVFQKGYKLNGRVIRAARVIVAKEKTT